MVEIARDYMRAGEDGDTPRVHGKDNNDRDDDDFHRDHGRGPNSNRKNDSSHGPMRRDKFRNHGRRDNRYNDRFGSQQSNYDNQNLLMDLTKTPREILATEEMRTGFAPPSAVHPRFANDRSKYCDFHEENGHNIDNCIQLREQIKVALRAGKLDHLLPKRKVKKDDAAKTFGWQRKEPQDRAKAPELTIN